MCYVSIVSDEDCIGPLRRRDVRSVPGRRLEGVEPLVRPGHRGGRLGWSAERLADRLRRLWRSSGAALARSSQRGNDDLAPFRLAARRYFRSAPDGAPGQVSDRKLQAARRIRSRPGTPAWAAAKAGAER